MMARAQALLGGRVDLLVNNAGCSGSFQPFTQATGEQICQVWRGAPALASLPPPAAAGVPGTG
jgi:hypothetical protein